MLQVIQWTERTSNVEVIRALCPDLYLNVYSFVALFIERTEVSLELVCLGQL